MSTIWIEKKDFVMLKLARCTNSFKLCRLVVEKLFLERKLVNVLS